MFILWSTVAVIAALAVVLDSLVRYARTEKHELTELTVEEQGLCAQVVSRGLARPLICRKAVQTGSCPCLPCEALEKARKGILFAGHSAA